MLAYFRIVKPLPDDVKEKLRADAERLPPRSAEQKAEDREMHRRFTTAHRRVSADSAALRQQYPDQWIAMDAEQGVLAAADTWEDLYRKLKATGHSHRGVAIRQMDGKSGRRIFIT